MLVFECQVCRTTLSAGEPQAGQLVRCPKCMTAVRVPAAQAPAPIGAGVGESTAPRITRPAATGRMLGQPQKSALGARFGFSCGYCSSRLEATENMSGQEGQCPTCGSTIIIPIRDRYGRLIDPMTGKIIKQDPHPVHAYAAAGERAPRILRENNGTQTILCPRCQSMSPIAANNCKSCGMPFTMEGTTAEGAGVGSNGFCVASLVLGIISIPACVVFVPAVLAIIFGIIGYNQVTRAGGEGSSKNMAIAGIICGTIGFGIAIMYVLK